MVESTLTTWGNVTPGNEYPISMPREQNKRKAESYLFKEGASFSKIAWIDASE